MQECAGKSSWCTRSQSAVCLHHADPAGELSRLPFFSLTSHFAYIVHTPHSWREGDDTAASSGRSILPFQVGRSFKYMRQLLWQSCGETKGLLYLVGRRWRHFQDASRCWRNVYTVINRFLFAKDWLLFPLPFLTLCLPLHVVHPLSVSWSLSFFDLLSNNLPHLFWYCLSLSLSSCGCQWLLSLQAEGRNIAIR